MQELGNKGNNALNYDRFKNLICILLDSFSARFNDFQHDSIHIDI